MKFTSRMIAAVAMAAMLSGCAVDGMNKTATYGGIGVLAGAAAGALAGGHDRGKGALIGAALGGAAGAGYGYYVDRQEAALRQSMANTGVEVLRQGDQIRLIMPGNITFRSNSADIASGFYNPLNSVAASIKQYDQSMVVVTGHTDNTGSRQRNLALSQERALSVSSYLQGQGVSITRLVTQGAGPDQPLADNNSDFGRQQNRRVEITLQPRG